MRRVLWGHPRLSLITYCCSHFIFLWLLLLLRSYVEVHCALFDNYAKLFRSSLYVCLLLLRTKLFLFILWRNCRFLLSSSWGGGFVLNHSLVIYVENVTNRGHIRVTCFLFLAFGSFFTLFGLFGGWCWSCDYHLRGMHIGLSRRSRLLNFEGGFLLFLLFKRLIVIYLLDLLSDSLRCSCCNFNNLSSISSFFLANLNWLGLVRDLILLVIDYEFSWTRILQLILTKYGLSLPHGGHLWV